MRSRRTAGFRIHALAWVVLAATACAERPPVADSHRERPGIGAWVTYWQFEEGVDRVAGAREPLTDVMFFAVHLDPNGKPVPAQPDNDLRGAVARARAAGATVWLTAVNDVARKGKIELKGDRVVHDLLFDQGTRSRHRSELVNLALSYDVDGLDIDYENLRPEDRERFSDFIAELAADLRRHGLLLSVTVQPKTAERAVPGPGAADWKRLCESVDRLQVMIYNLHNARTRPGPVATPRWMNRVLDFALERCPRDRVVPVFKLGGYDWGDSEVFDATYRSLDAKVRSGGNEWEWDDARLAPYLEYDQDGERRVAYVENARSLELKLGQIADRGLGSVMLWSLGSEDPAILGGRKALSVDQSRQDRENSAPSER